MECGEDERTWKVKDGLYRMNQNSIDILGICETNWTNKGSFRTHDNNLTILAGKDEGEATVMV